MNGIDSTSDQGTRFCLTCEKAAADGWSGQKASHCPGCHREWTGLTEAHCASCHRHFATVELFDAHREHGATK